MITEIRHGNQVKRYHTKHRTVSETVGHHSANLCGIILRLEPACSKSLLVEALMHDIPEALTGDIPANAKWLNADLSQGIKDLEYEYIVSNELPEGSLTAYETKLLKLADMLDLVLSSLEEVGRGNMYAKALVAIGQKKIMEMNVSKKLQLKIEMMVAEVKGEWQLMIDR